MVRPILIRELQWRVTLVLGYGMESLEVVSRGVTVAVWNVCEILKVSVSVEGLVYSFFLVWRGEGL